MHSRNQLQNAVHLRHGESAPSTPSQQAAFLERRSQSTEISGQPKAVAATPRSKRKNASPGYRTPLASKSRNSDVSKTPKLPSYLLNVRPKIDTNLHPKKDGVNNPGTTAQQSKKRTSVASPNPMIHKKKCSNSIREIANTVAPLHIEKSNSLLQNLITNGTDFAPTINANRNFTTIQELIYSLSQFRSNDSIIDKKKRDFYRTMENFKSQHNLFQKRSEAETLVKPVKANSGKLEQEKAELSIQFKENKNTNDATEEEKTFVKNQITELRNINMALSDKLKAVKKDTASESALIQQEMSKLKETLCNCNDADKKRIEAENLYNRMKLKFEEIQTQFNENNAKAKKEMRGAKSRNVELENDNLILKLEKNILEESAKLQQKALVVLKKRLQNIADVNQSLDEIQFSTTNSEELGREKAEWELKFNQIQAQLHENDVKMGQEKASFEARIELLQEDNNQLRINLNFQSDEHEKKSQDAKILMNQLNAKIDLEVRRAETLSIKLKCKTKSLKKAKLRMKKQIKDIVRKKNKEIARILAEIESDAEETDVSEDVTDNDGPEEQTPQQFFESLAIADPPSQRIYAAGNGPQLLKYKSVLSVNWEFVETGKVSSGIKIIAAAASKIHNIQMTFVGKYLNGYLFNCPRCQYMYASGKAFLELKNGILQVKTGGHRSRCKVKLALSD